MLADGRESSVFYVIATLSMALRWQRARGHVTQLQLMLSFEQCVNHRRGREADPGASAGAGGHRQAGPVAGAVFAIEVIPLLGGR
jgi:hypothetical protein